MVYCGWSSSNVPARKRRGRPNAARLTHITKKMLVYRIKYALIFLTTQRTQRGRVYVRCAIYLLA